MAAGSGEWRGAFASAEEADMERHGRGQFERSEGGWGRVVREGEALARRMEGGLGEEARPRAAPRLAWGDA